MKFRNWIGLKAVGLGIAMSLPGACAHAPVTGRSQLIIVPDDVMDSMGLDSYQQMKTETPVSRDPKINATVQRIGKRIAKASGKKYDWEFTVFDAPDVVNAFCLPGGKVGVYTGILPVAETEAGLAAILGHEVAHAVAKHGAERVSQSLLVELGLSVAELSLEDSDQNGLILGALGLGAQVGLLLPYSRTHESEADFIGTDYMAKAGYEPAEAAALWDRMAALGSGGPEFLSTHPDSGRRAKEIRKEMSRFMKLYHQSDPQPSRLLPGVSATSSRKASSQGDRSGETKPKGKADDPAKDKKSGKGKIDKKNKPDGKGKGR